MEKKDNDMQQILESQLHEQYAINNNSNLSSVVTLFVALIAVFGGYGYIFIHSSLYFKFEKMYCNCTELYSMDALVFAATASFIVIAFMKHICLYQGYHQRFEQFITYAIRHKYHMIDECPGNNIFPNDYSPFKDIKRLKKDLSHGQHGLAQGLFGEFLKLFFWIQITIIVSLIIKMGYNLHMVYKNSYSFSKDVALDFICFFIVLVISYIINCIYENKLKRRYIKLIREYKSICPSNCNMDEDEESCIKELSKNSLIIKSKLSSIIKIIIESMNKIGRKLLFVFFFIITLTSKVEANTNNPIKLVTKTKEMNVTNINDPITFADAEVKSICVNNWDTNGDGELSKAEAAAVENLGEVFKSNPNVKSFDELQYFTGLRSLQMDVFANCSSLTSISIPSSVIAINRDAFYRCSSLMSVAIPNTVTFIAALAFSGCTGLNSIKVESGNKYYDSRDACNAIIETSSNTLIIGCKNTIIPNSVKSIGSSAFQGSGLTSITIPSSVKSIGSYAFSSCSSLASITIPSSVTNIGECAFQSSGLTSITIPNSVITIHSATFRECKSLTSVTIPNSVTSIGVNAFFGCHSLTSVTIPNSVISIGSGAFDWCINLISVTIPNSVTTIESLAFYDCHSLTSVTIPSSVTSIGRAAFGDCSSLTSITIPNSVTSIGAKAFYGCNSLTSITIPNSVTSIGAEAFQYCSRLAFIVWDTDFAMPSDIGNIRPWVLFYTKDASYAPSDMINVIVNGVAKEILLSGDNNFYCPREFTAEKISYTHNYRMTSGIDGLARGWETIALPFTVSEITHWSKGKLLPFGAWTTTSDAKPFWLCKLSSSGFTRATTIEANTPYIICMPNNSDYDSSFNLSGNVTFSATNVKVPVSSSLATAKSNDKSFIPAFCSQDKSSTVYALNVNNSYHSELGGYTEGSAFVSDLRKVSPFEAYMTTSDSNAKRSFLIDFNETTGIDEIPTTDMKDGTHKLYNLNGQLVKQTKSQQELDETLRQLPAGVYVVNGKKTIVK